MVVLEKGIPQAMINQPADKLTSKSDNAAATTGSGLFFTATTIPEGYLSVNQGGEWLKVSQIKPGMEVATVEGWEKIVSIKEYAREQVYDIEVDQTHNFLANNIVAHNTYINGSLGLGTNFTGVTTPANGLAVSGNVGIGTTTANNPLSVVGGASFGTYSQITAPSNGLIVSGNLGIGNSVPQYTLDIKGVGANILSSDAANTPTINTGTGSDGALTVDQNATFNINSDTSNGRSVADGVNFTSTVSTSASSTSIVLSATSTGLAVGDEVLIINMKGTSSDYSNVGKYETKTITSISTTTVSNDTLNFTALTNAYDGTTQKIQVQRIPQYTNVTVKANGTLTTGTWSSTTGKGGVLFFRATGKVDVQSTGTISASGKGYAGGAGVAGGGPTAGAGGETYNGAGGNGSGATAQGGGGGGSVSGTTGGGGGGGTYGDSYGGGGGGGYGTVGSGAATGGQNGSGATGGNGGTSGGGGGGTYGSATLSQIYFGSGGGGGSEYSGSSDRGGVGGGIVVVSSNNLTVTGTITSNGTTPTNDYLGSEGGGAGGSVYLLSNSLNVGSSLVTASGGAGSAIGGGGLGVGGNGGSGRIRLDYTTLSGTTSPSAGYTLSASGSLNLNRTDTGKVLSIQSNGTERLSVDDQGRLYGLSNATGGNVYSFNDNSITNGSLLYGSVGVGTTAYNLMQLQSGSTLTDKFLIDALGNTTIAGNLTLSKTSPTISLDQNDNLSSLYASALELSTGEANLGYGTGADGACSVSSTITLDAASSNTCSGRSTADSVNFRSTVLTGAGSTSITTSTTPTGLSVGDEMLIINLKGTSTDNVNVGKYETRVITSISTNTLSFSKALLNNYDGTTQKIMVQRIPQYTNVTVSSGGTLTITAWSNSNGKGGVLFFRATGTVTVASGGTISTAGKGYAGGSGVAGSGPTAGAGGETYNGAGGNGNTLGTTGQGGGGGSRNGLAISGTPGGGGGGGAGTYGGGGGGGYGGVGSGAATGGQNGSGVTGGNGGASGGGGGSTYGSTTLSQIYFGSGGGGGAEYNGSSDTGGKGGGIIVISSNTLTVTGTITSNGTTPVNTYLGSEGGGAGGSVYLLANSLNIGSSLVTASAGSGAEVASQGAGAGGNGGSGRIRLDYASLSGTTSPSAGYTYVAKPQLAINNLGIGNILSLQNNGIDKFIVNALGNVGIGTSAGAGISASGLFQINSNYQNPFVVTSGGYVGIGVTSPLNALSVFGGVGIGATGSGGFANSLAPTNGLAVQGNLGVGTTSPLGSLHVVGQCVAKGTRIRRRRKKKGSTTDDVIPADAGIQLTKSGSELDSRLRGNDSEWIYEDIPVEDIKPDDEVLSLNDKTGEWEWNKVEKTMDMGIQEVFRLETEGGKWIETTKKHPYLVRDFESYEKQQDDNQNQTISNANFDINIFNIKFSFTGSLHNTLLNRYANIKDIIASNIFNGNTHRLGLALLEANKVINPAANQPADKFTNHSETIADQTESISNSISQAKWLKVFQIKPGMVIATTNGWEKIRTIYSTGRKQTFDIEVEGTHNFVGNNIVAHNTYINGSLGLGTAFTGATIPTNGLAVSGNVGIGTTSPLYNLDVIGTGHFTGALTLDSTATLATSLTTPLVIGGTATTSDLTLQTTSGAGTTGADMHFLVGNNGATEAMTILNNGNVGINAVNAYQSGPTAKLDIVVADVGGGILTEALRLQIDSIINIGDGPFIGFRYPNSEVARIGGFLNLSGAVNGALSFQTANAGSMAERMKIDHVGNVGIGTSASGAALQVNGGGLFGWGTASSSLSSGAILGVNGNVGVGTTSPLGALHVVGQCVAEGTLIKRRRRRKRKLDDGGLKLDDEVRNLKLENTENPTSNLQSQNPSSNIQHLTSDWIYEDVPVEDIKPDDEVLSLNDKTGEWEWNKVEKTMDMGIKDIYELVTESGKSIKTTKEHPYLIRKALSFRRSAQESNVNQCNSNYIQSQHNGTSAKELINIDIHQFILLSLKNIPTNRAIIPAGKFNINSSRYFEAEIPKNPGEISNTPNQPEAKLMDRSANPEVTTGLESSCFISSNLAYKTNLVNLTDASDAKWAKVYQIRPGQYVATTDGWEKIVSIQKIGRKQTYDLQIENTHNFVGNNIVAHNTYINGSLGLGTNFTGATTPTNGLAVSGNLGIGTTTASHNLEVVGTGAFSSALSLANGLATTPALNFTNLTNAGLWTNGDGLLLTTGGTNTKGITVTGSGNVGIGTTNPGSLFTIGTNALQVNSGGSIFLQNNAGIALLGGTPVANTITASGINGASDGNFAIYANGATSKISIGDINGIGGGAAGAGLINITRGTTNIVDILKNGGNVGIGTSSPGSKLSVIGNVGIGTSAAGAALQVNGGGLFGWGTASSSLSSGAILGVNGNVGVGTTSPLGALHVVGQCVTGDTLLKRRRRKKKLSVISSQLSDDSLPDVSLSDTDKLITDELESENRKQKTDNWIYDDVRIDQIQPGDEVLSLNDKTGEWEWNKVEKTMDMGIQEVFELLTTTGKSIQTTANHPYLVIEGKLLIEDQNSKKNSNADQTKSNSNFKVPVNDLFIFHKDNYTTNPLNVNETINPSTPSRILNTSGIGLNLDLTANMGKMMAAPKKPADKLINKSDNVIINVSFIPSILPFVENAGKWIKVSQLKKDQFIAALGKDGQPQFEKIVAITKVGRVKTYDLQIESTHNFVGNNIVAHNTYINGSLGLGTNFTGATTPTNGLAVQGNVGIGTTTANSNLTVIGGATIGADYGGYTAPTNGLLIQGNIGIGTSTSANPITVGTDGTNGNGAYLTAGGTWTNGSSFEFKENFTELNSLDILSKINSLNLTSWNYKIEGCKDVIPSSVIPAEAGIYTNGGDDSGCNAPKHIGPIAEEFYSVFGLGNDNKHISTIDPSGVALVGIQGLSLDISNIKDQISKLQLDMSKLNYGMATGSAQIATPSASVIPSKEGIQLTTSDPELDTRLPANASVALQAGLRGYDMVASPSAEATPSSTLNPQDSTFHSLSSTVKDFNLTDPSILLATDSGRLTSNLTMKQFNNLSVSDATISGMLKTYDLNISNSLKSLGQTFLGNTNIAGDLSVDGTLSISNGSEINVVGSCQSSAFSPQTNTNQSDDRRLTTDDCTGILYLQNSPLAQGLDIFNGKVKIDKEGKLSVQKLQVSNKTLGSSIIPAGKLSVTIINNQVTDNSKIFVTPTSSTGGQALIVSDQKSGESFTISLDHLYTSDIKFNWWIVDSE